MKNLLSRSRLVTLTGIGGVGKTRLAMRVAVERAARLRRRCVRWSSWANCATSRCWSTWWPPRWGCGTSRRGRLREVLVEFLAPRELLLVLDNCEHVVDAVAELAETLLRTCPGLRILATSREPLGIGGEAVLRVPPLAVPDPDRPAERLPGYDAVTLFAERAAAAVPGFELTEDNTVTVAGICQRLDGLPLPIELAAARLRAMSPEQILRAADRPLPAADPRQPGRADAATDPAVVHRLELRAVHPGGTTGVGAAVGVRG